MKFSFLLVGVLWIDFLGSFSLKWCFRFYDYQIPIEYITCTYSFNLLNTIWFDLRVK